MSSAQSIEFDFTREWHAPDSFRAQSVVGTYSLSDVKLEKHFKGVIELPEKWSVGAIVGHSGTGKTSIAKTAWPNDYIRGFEYKEPCVLDDFPESCKNDEISIALSSVGFSSPPDWLKAYDCLSQGEKMRVDVARALCLPERDLVVFDEWTSVVDREVAKIASLAVSKAVRRAGRKFVAVTCHSDILDWLETDWVFDTQTMKTTKKKDATHPLSLVFINALAPSGRFLGNIII